MEIKDTQTVRVQIGKSVKKISLQRFIVTKIVLEPKKIGSRDIYALFSNQIWLQDKCYREKEFREKFALALEALARILKNINLTTDINEERILKLGSRIKIELETFLIPTRNYQSFKGKFEGTYHLIFTRPEGTLTSKLPPVRYIGVGYKDKGSASKPEIDGSPNWKDIASSAENILREISDALEILKKGTEDGKEINLRRSREISRYIRSKVAELQRLKRDPRRSQDTPKENKAKN